MADTPRVTVPVEPTEAMMRAWHRSAWPQGPEVSPMSQAGLAFKRHYAAMLTAAPVREEGGAVDVRAIALEAMKDARRCGESNEMCARWISERVNRALAAREEAPAEAGEEAIKAACVAWHQAKDENPFNVLYHGAWCGSFPHQTGPERWTFTVPAMKQAVEAYLRTQPQAREEAQPVAVTIFCPECSLPHVDEGEWATTRRHKTHQCQGCGHEWRPFPFATVGVSHPTTPPAPEAEKIIDRYEMADALLASGIAIGVSTWPDEQRRDALSLADAALAALQAEQKGGA